MKKIQLFKPTFEIDDCLNSIRECLELGWTGIGFKTVEFEKQFSSLISCSDGYFTNSNTCGMELLLKMLKHNHLWLDDDEVISTPLTFVSTNHSIYHANLKPIFADVDESLCINLESVRKVITPKTRAIIFVAIGGNVGHLPELQEYCQNNNLLLILDAAHACGSRFNGQYLNHYADYSVFSFQAVKNLPTADSGFVTLNSSDEKALIQKLGWCGINKDTYNRSQVGYAWQYDVEFIGHKYHGNSIMAAIALSMLPKIDSYNSYRRELAQTYRKNLESVSEVTYVKHRNEGESSRHLVQFQAENRDQLIEFLKGHGVDCGVHYVSNTRYKMYRHMPCPVSEAFDQTLISFPLHMQMSLSDVDYISDKVKIFYSNAVK